MTLRLTDWKLFKLSNPLCEAVFQPEKSGASQSGFFNERLKVKWLKHDTNSTADAKLKKLILKYGTDGYAIYFHCLELIAGDINESNITFELEHDAEIIADNLKIKGTPDISAIDLVNNIMLYIIELKLFEESNGRIFCYKLLKRLDKSMTGNAKFRNMIDNAKQSHDTVMIGHDSVMQEETILQENRKEEKDISSTFKISKYLFEQIVEKVNPTSFNSKSVSSSAKSWHDDIDKLLRIDKAKKNDIKTVIDFALDNDFWCTNVWSGNKLRKHFDKILIEANKESGVSSAPKYKELEDV